MRNYFFRIAAALLLCCTAINSAHADDAIPPSPIVKTELLVNAPSIEVGDTIWVAVHFKMPPKWHIYAKNPGDSGIPTAYTWTLPAGITAGEIIWPTPETLTEAGFTNYGYSNEITLVAPLTITAKPAENRIELKANWLACDQACIPESAIFSATLPYHDDATSAKIAAAKKQAHAEEASPAPDAKSPQPTTAQPTIPLSFIVTLGLAFIGGLLLNIMPCVLPILSLKCLTLVKKASASRKLARAHGVAYTSGVMISFLIIASLLIGLRSTGEAIGWGFQLQSPIIVAALFVLMVAVTANLLGMFELPVLFGGVEPHHESRRGTFLTGVLAVAVATPCTAPFMASAIGATLLLPPAASLLVFATMGLGMAAPFLLVSFFPAALAFLPKPGAWMHRFKQFLAIPMGLTALWLAFVLAQLVAPHNNRAPEGYSLLTPENYSAERLDALRAQHRPVLLDATAAWCLTCKVNEHVALKPEETQAFLRDHDVTLMVADWTKSDPEITALLAEFHRNGVPLYVFYPANGEPVVLPQVLTPKLVMDTIYAGLPGAN